MKEELVLERIENTVIGSCLIDAECFEQVKGFDIGIEHFTQQNAKEVFQLMNQLYEAGFSIDLVTIGANVTNARRKELIPYMVETTNIINTTQHIDSHCYFLIKEYQTRQRREIAAKMAFSESYDELESLTTQLRQLDERIDISIKGKNTTAISEFVAKSRKEYARRAELYEKGELGGITTGLLQLDNLTQGWQNSRLTILAARPGMGKTALAVHFALSAAYAGKKVLIFALEMTGQEITDRMICAVSNINVERFRTGIITSEENEELAKAEKILNYLPINIDDTPIQTTAYIKASAKSYKKQEECDFVIVDYLQLVDMTSGTNRNINREQQVAKASRDFKLMAKELDVPIMVLSQLNRGVEDRTEKRPMLSDLRDSGSIEQDADQVIFVYRPEYYNNDDFDKGKGEIIIAKNRAGGLGIVEFYHNESLTKIRDASISNYE